MHIQKSVEVLYARDDNLQIKLRKQFQPGAGDSRLES
jgi:hypothetical protein